MLSIPERNTKLEEIKSKIYYLGRKYEIPQDEYMKLIVQINRIRDDWQEE